VAGEGDTDTTGVARLTGTARGADEPDTQADELPPAGAYQAVRAAPPGVSSLPIGWARHRVTTAEAVADDLSAAELTRRSGAVAAMPSVEKVMNPSRGGAPAGRPPTTFTDAYTVTGEQAGMAAPAGGRSAETVRVQGRAGATGGGVGSSREGSGGRAAAAMAAVVVAFLLGAGGGAGGSTPKKAAAEAGSTRPRAAACWDWYGLRREEGTGCATAARGCGGDSVVRPAAAAVVVDAFDADASLSY
jgi:hypothetical protein